MTDTAPTTVDDSKSWTDQLGALLLKIAEAKITYKAATLNAKSKALLDANQQSATSSNDKPAGDDSGSFAKYAPWIAGGLVVVALFVALRR